MKVIAALSLALLAVLPACGAESAAPGPSSEPVPLADGDAFEARFDAIEVATDWAWELARATTAPESGSCGYVRDASSAPTGSFQAAFSRDPTALDPISGAPYLDGHFHVVAEGTFAQVAVHAAPSAAYRCGSAGAVEAERVRLSAYVEASLGMDPDGVRFTGYVMRFYVLGMGAPIDAATERPVMVGFSIPAPLRVQGSAAADDAGAVVLTFEGSEDPTPPEFAIGLGLGIRGMSATSRVRFEPLRLERAALTR